MMYNDAMKIEHVHKIASKVRRQCQGFRRTKACDPYDFKNKSDLDCMCAVASFALKSALNKRGAKAKVVFGVMKQHGDTKPRFDHCWVRVGRNYVDITATQFGYKEKVLISKKDDNKYRAWKEHEREEEIKWGFEQNPTKELTKKILKIKVK